MYILQLRSLTSANQELVAVARSENLDLLSVFVKNCLNLAEDDLTLKYYSSLLPDGVTSCTKVFKLGTPLEYYTPPEDSSTMIVNLGTLEERIDDLIAELRKHATENWNSIVVGVVNIGSLEEALALRTVEVTNPIQINEASANE